MIEPSIPALLRQRASLQPDDVAFTYVDYEHDWDGVPESLTWSQVYRRTLNLAQQLRLGGSAGDRAVILAPQGLEYIISFLGAIQAGLIPVPLSVPLGGVSDERVSSVMRDAAPAAILTTSTVVGNVAAYAQPRAGESAPTIIEVDSLDLDSRSPGDGPRDSFSDIAYLQYTSGSTSQPAGVMISHKNLLANYEQLVSDFFVQYGRVIAPDVTMVSWLPFYHDMGLIVGIGFPVLSGLRSVVTSPVSFLQRPARWMQLIASHTRALSGGPNFAFDLTARKTSDADMAGLDLGDVWSILSGSERVQPATLQRFAERFARFNLHPKVLRPSYGMAEATVYIATREWGEAPEIVHFEAEKLTAGRAERCASGSGTPLVSYGAPQSPIVRIVDPDTDTDTECPAGTVGEIWVHGDNVADGYWGEPESRKNTFGATLLGASAGTPEKPWLRTGDLGFFSDGELFIIGRIKDLLIVYGRNHSPDDIEATIQEITRGRCVAISVPDDGGVEQLVAIVELKKQDDSEEAAAQRMGVVRRELTSALSKSHGLSVADLVLVSQGSIPITTSGKVRRRECLQLYLRDEFTRLDGSIRRPEQRKVRDITDIGAGAGDAAGLARRVRSLAQQQHDLLVGVVCSQAATVLDHPSPNDIDPECTFQELGFDSVKAAELLDRLNTATELTLQPALAFDYPTPAALATYLGQQLSGSFALAPPVGSTVTPRVQTDEPVAVVGMACRFPGGVDSAAALWDLVAGGTDAVGESSGRPWLEPGGFV